MQRPMKVKLMMRKILGFSVAITLLSLWSGVLSADPLLAQHQSQWRSNEQYQQITLDLDLPADALSAAVAQVAKNSASVSNAQKRENENRYRHRNQEKKSYNYGNYGENSRNASPRYPVRSGNTGGSIPSAAGKKRQ